MYWGLIFLAVSLLSLPFALDQPIGGNGAALILVGIFALLSVIAFLFGRSGGADERREDELTRR